MQRRCIGARIAEESPGRDTSSLLPVPEGSDRVEMFARFEREDHDAVGLLAVLDVEPAIVPTGDHRLRVHGPPFVVDDRSAGRVVDLEWVCGTGDG